jgi:hypothetical protein
MRTYELRIYTLPSHEALEAYRTINYPRHLTSLTHHDVGLHGLWTARDGSPALYALVPMPRVTTPRRSLSCS